MIKSIFKIAYRNLTKSPIHSSINILGLSMGITAVLLISLWIQHHYSFDQFHTNADQIYRVMENKRNAEGEIQTTEGAVYKVMEEARESISGIEDMTRIVSHWRWPSKLCFKSDSLQECVYQQGIYADSSFFPMFDFEILRGASNPILDPRSIAISETMATKVFGDKDALNATYKIDGHYEVKIAAIFKDTPVNSSLQFDFVAPMEVLLGLWGQTQEQISHYSFITYVKTSKSPDTFATELKGLSTMAQLENTDYILQPFTQQHLYSTFEAGQATGGLITYLKMFALFAIFIFIISIVNFINLATAKSALRAKEIGVRKATGATKLGIMLQFIAEAFFKVMISMLVVLLLIYYMLPLLNQLVGEQLQLVFTMESALFVSAIVVICTLLTGIYPAFVMSRFNPIRALKNLQSLSMGKQPIRKWLTLIQICISVVVVLVTIVVYQQIDYLQTKDLGYDRNGIMQLEPTYSHVKNFDTFRNQLTNSPLVESIGVSNSDVLNASFATSDIAWPGKNEGDELLFKVIGADMGFVETFNLKLLEGNGFNPNSDIIQVILTTSAVDLMGLNEPLGSKLQYFNEEAEIVGVIPDFNSESLHVSRLPVVLYQIKPENSGVFYIRYDKENPKEAIEHITAQYNSFEKYFSIRYSLLDEKYEAQYKDELVIGKIAFATTAISIILALVGLLGLSSYNLIRRYKEIGLRKIFGASSIQVVNLLVKDFIIIVLMANLAAWPLAIYIGNYWLDSYAYRIEMPIMNFIISLTMIIGTVLLIISTQAYKATSVNPVETLKEE